MPASTSAVPPARDTYAYRDLDRTFPQGSLRDAVPKRFCALGLNIEYLIPACRLSREQRVVRSTVSKDIPADSLATPARQILSFNYFFGLRSHT
jgi:hypothetical protein